MKDYHKKPTKKERSVQDAINHAAVKADALTKCVQVKASDWDLVILADEVARLQEYEWKYKDLCK